LDLNDLGLGSGHMAYHCVEATHLCTYQISFKLEKTFCGRT